MYPPPDHPAEDGVPVHKGDGDNLGGCHYCHEQPHQGHDRQGMSTADRASDFILVEVKPDKFIYEMLSC